MRNFRRHGEYSSLLRDDDDGTDSPRPASPSSDAE